MYRPDNWPKCPCDSCDHPDVDDYGYLCDLACGKRSAWFNREAGADAMLEVLIASGDPVDTSSITKVKDGVMIAPVGKGTLVFIPDKE